MTSFTVRTVRWSSAPFWSSFETARNLCWRITYKIFKINSLHTLVFHESHRMNVESKVSPKFVLMSIVHQVSTPVYPLVLFSNSCWNALSAVLDKATWSVFSPRASEWWMLRDTIGQKSPYPRSVFQLMKSAVNNYSLYAVSCLVRSCFITSGSSYITSVQLIDYLSSRYLLIW